VGDGGKQRKASENSGRRWGTAGDDRGRRGTVGDGGGRHNAARPGPWLLLVGQVQEKTGRDDEMSSVLVLAQDGRTAPLRTLFSGDIEMESMRSNTVSHSLESAYGSGCWPLKQVVLVFGS